MRMYVYIHKVYVLAQPDHLQSYTNVQYFINLMPSLSIIRFKL